MSYFAYTWMAVNIAVKYIGEDFAYFCDIAFDIKSPVFVYCRNCCSTAHRMSRVCKAASHYMIIEKFSYPGLHNDSSERYISAGAALCEGDHIRFISEIHECEAFAGSVPS